MSILLFPLSHSLTFTFCAALSLFSALWIVWFCAVELELDCLLPGGERVMVL